MGPPAPARDGDTYSEQSPVEQLGRSRRVFFVLLLYSLNRFFFLKCTKTVLLCVSGHEDVWEGGFEKKTTSNCDDKCRTCDFLLLLFCNEIYYQAI